MAGSSSIPRVDDTLLPPGPRLPGLVQSIALLRFRQRWFPSLQRTYGDVFTVRMLPAGRRLVVFHQPEHVKEIFAGDPEIFHAGKGNAILGPVMGEHSLLLVDSTQHRRARKMLMPAFSSRAMKGYTGLIEEIARAEVDSWPEHTTVRALDRMNALTLEVILQVVFGVTDEARLVRLRPLVTRVVQINPAVFLGYGYPFLQKLGPWKRTVENIAALDEAIYDEIAQRRSDPDSAGRTDVLSQLLHVVDDETGEGLTDEELRDQLVTLLLAGHETTASALSWTLHELAKDPDQQARARAGDDRYLEAVLKEGMRLHPVIPMVVRCLMAPATVGGLDLPAGTNVAASILLAHDDPQSHPDPEAFRPERFLGDEVHPNTWIPFGGGVRRCIGAGFSLMEGTVVLRALLEQHQLSLPAGEPDEVVQVRNITSVPKRGSRVLVSRLSE
ncbi:MAG: cytochrome P450 [Myxococcales bacterium]|nr:MAG: cytochrome P450 [Myxococcales bacterium]